MTEIELKMARVIAELSRMNAPVIFKGAMTLKLALMDEDLLNVSRLTRDIDGDWLHLDTSMAEIGDMLARAVNRVDKTLTVVPFREFAEGKSAGFEIKTQEDDILFSVDLSVRHNKHEKMYGVVIAGERVSIRGVPFEKMLADKIVAISTRKIFSRAKDMVDIYILSHYTGFQTDKIIQTMRDDDKELGEFNAFQFHPNEIKHAYDKLKGIDNKPDFTVLYERVSSFVEPFIKNEYAGLEWSGERWEHLPEKASSAKDYKTGESDSLPDDEQENEEEWSR
mgnify:CR=1 FL=1